jgi:hypothetical protein
VEVKASILKWHSVELCNGWISSPNADPAPPIDSDFFTNLGLTWRMLTGECGDQL